MFTPLLLLFVCFFIIFFYESAMSSLEKYLLYITIIIIITYNKRQSKFMSLGGQLVLQIGRFNGLLQVTNVGVEIQLRDVHR